MMKWAVISGKRGAYGKGGDDVGRSAGKAHAEDHGNEAHEQDGDERAAVGEGREQPRELEPDTRQADERENDADATHEAADAERVAPAEHHRFIQHLEVDLTALDAVDYDEGDDPAERGHARRIPEGHDHDNDHDGDEEVPPLTADGPGGGDVMILHLPDVVLFGFKMDEGHQRDVIQDDRAGGDGHDGKVGDLGEFGHKEGHGTHDGRHDLPARGGGGFDGARHMRPVADLLHHGNGQYAGGRDVGHGAAGDGAEERAADDGGLGRSAHGIAGEREGQTDEEIPGSGLFQKSAHEDERGHVLDHHLGGKPVVAFHARIDLRDHRFEIEAAVPEVPGDDESVQRIEDEDDGHQRQRPADDPAPDLKAEEQHQAAEEDIHFRQHAQPHEAIQIFPDGVGRTGDAADDEQPVHKGDVVDLRLFFEGVNDQRHTEDGHDVEAVLPHHVGADVDGPIDYKRGYGRKADIDDPFRGAGKDAFLFLAFFGNKRLMERRFVHGIPRQAFRKGRGKAPPRLPGGAERM